MRAPLLILRKDLLVLWRSPLLLGVLIAYPLVIALLIGLAAAYANAKPRVAVVGLEQVPHHVTVAGNTFDIDALIHEVAKNVELVRMDEGAADQQLASGRVAAVITIPDGFVGELEGLVASPHISVATGTGGITPRVRQQMQALVYNLNLKLQKAFIEADIKYVQLLLHGGKGKVLGHDFSIIGLDGTKQLLAHLPASPEKAQIADFVHDARLALALTDNAIRATAAPIILDEEKGRGRTSALSAQAQAYGLAITISFLGLLLAGGALAAERDENAIGRLDARPRRPRQLIVAKIALAVDGRARASASRSWSASGSRCRPGGVRGGSRGSACRSSSSACVARRRRSAPSGRSSGHSRASRGRRRSSACSPSCRSSSSGSSRGRSSPSPRG
jgi:ABC-2 type transport system permease protein